MNSKIKSQLDDEVDLLGLFLTIWNNKLKVFFVGVVTIVAMFGFQAVVKYVPEYVATTEIRPISTFDELEYKNYNLYYTKTNQKIEQPSAINANREKEDETELEKQVRKDQEREKEIIPFQQIERSYLVDLFIEKLKENILFKNEIKRFGMVKKEDYEDQQAYEDAVTKLASLIKFLPPNSNIKQGKIEPYWRIQFVTNDKQMWEKFLKNIIKPANEEVRLHLNKKHRKFIEIKKKLKKFNIEDIEMQMTNAIINYENMASRKLTYLNEQAKIARTLNVAKNNILESQSFRTDTAVITTLISEIPYYMRGYEMIEEEILLIKKRDDKKAFIKNFDILEKTKRSIISNKDMKRLGELFKGTPAYNSDDFYAAKIMFQSTDHDFVNERNTIKMVSMAFIIGALLGIFYVLMSNAIRNRR